MSEYKPNKPVVMPRDGFQKANPFMPMWERIPDGEPRVFTDPWSGKERLYVYGSHDTVRGFCGPDHVVWSAPLDDLTDWRHEGVAFHMNALEGLAYADENGEEQIVHLVDGHVLYAPDVVYNPTTKKYTMLLFLAGKEPASLMFAAFSDWPGGPYADAHFVGLGFDPSVLVDDVLDEKGHQRMYLYWSVEADRTGWAAELDPESVTIIPGTQHNPRINGVVEGQNTMFSQCDAPFHYFEGPSMRKIGDVYVLSYARSKPDSSSIHGYLSEIAYATSDNPFGDPKAGKGWEYGGVIINNRGEYVENPYAAGEYADSFFGGNNHGGLIRAGENWYQIYHRMPNIFNRRQAMAVKVNVYCDEAGSLKIDEAEYTSEGFCINGLDPYRPLLAACMCYALPTGGSWRAPEGPVFAFNLGDDVDPAAERDNWYGVRNIRNHTWIGYKYYNFGSGVNADRLSLQLTLKEFAAGSVNIYAADARKSVKDPEQKKTLIGKIELTGENAEAHTVTGEIFAKDILVGKKAIYMEFITESEETVAEINELVFIAG